MSYITIILVYQYCIPGPFKFWYVIGICRDRKILGPEILSIIQVSITSGLSFQHSLLYLLEKRYETAQMWENIAIIHRSLFPKDFHMSDLYGGDG